MLKMDKGGRKSACFTNYIIVSLCLLLVRFVLWRPVEARPLLSPKESCGTCEKPNVVLVVCDSFVSILFSFKRLFRQFCFLLTLIEGKEGVMTQDSYFQLLQAPPVWCPPDILGV